MRVGRRDAHDAGGVAATGDAAVSAVTATARPAPPGPAAAGPILRLTRGEGTFGGTWQGEGSRLGTWTMGVRVYGCNLHCGLLKGVGVRPDGCDTAHTWYEQDYRRAEWAYEASVGQACQSWNSACSHGSSVVARGWCSSPAANLWSKGRRWASSCGAAGSGDGAPRSRPTAPWRRDGWAGPTAGLTTSTSPPSWRRASPGRRPGIQADPPEGDRRTAGDGPSGLEVRRRRHRRPGRDRLVDRTVRVADRQRLGHARGHQHRRPDRPYPAAGRGRAGPWPEPHHSPAHPRLGG